MQFLEENEFIYKDIQFIIINVESQVFETAASFREYLVSKMTKEEKESFLYFACRRIARYSKELLDVLNSMHSTASVTVFSIFHQQFYIFVERKNHFSIWILVSEYLFRKDI